MPTDEEHAALEAQLEAAVRVVIHLLRQNNKQLLDSIEQLKAQNAELRRMLFGRRSEKMPSMESEVRRALDAEELLTNAWGTTHDEQRQRARCRAARGSRETAEEARAKAQRAGTTSGTRRTQAPPPRDSPASTGNTGPAAGWI